MEAREKSVTVTMIKIMIALGIVGHAINMYCDRILSIFPNGTIKFDNIKEIEKDGVLAAYHVKCGFAEYVFLQLGRDRKAKDMMLDLLNCAPILQTCGVGVFVYIVTLIIAIVTGIIGFPLWALLFTIVPFVLLLSPFKIVGTMHIAAIVSMLGWIFLL